MKQTVSIVKLFISLSAILLVSCYKKDLEEFKSINGIKLQQEIISPLFHSNLTIKDTLPFSIPVFALSDTIKINASPNQVLDSINQTEVEYIELKLIIENNFKTKGGIQLYFVDDNKQIIDSLFSTTANNQFQEDSSFSSKSTTYIYLDNEKYYRIKNASKVYVLVELSNHNDNTFHENFLNIYAGVKFKLNKTIQ